MLNHNRPKVTTAKPVKDEAETVDVTTPAKKPTREEAIQALKDVKLTPTEELILEVLGARDRLGEPFWPFSTRYNAAIRSLAKKGFVSIIDGNVKKTVRVGYLNDIARAATLSPTYVAPIVVKWEEQERSREAAEAAEEFVRRHQAEATEAALALFDSRRSEAENSQELKGNEKAKAKKPKKTKSEKTKDKKKDKKAKKNKGKKKSN